jgi:hypothetical protein
MASPLGIILVIVFILVLEIPRPAVKSFRHTQAPHFKDFGFLATLHFEMLFFFGLDPMETLPTEVSIFLRYKSSIQIWN